MRTLYVATQNAGKLVELRALFAGTAWEPQTYEGYGDVVEGETSYAENAALKARALRATLLAVGKCEAVVGDDSGLEVAALGGRPGVLSARYGSARATWPERRALLRTELAASGSADRSARFVCALHFIDTAGVSIAVDATVDGTIAAADAGDGGFSYDAAFWYPSAMRTFAELSDTEKNAISHRGRAVRALLAALDHHAPSRDAESAARGVNDRDSGM